MIKHNNKEYVCYLDFAMDFIRSKWKAVILCHLGDGPKRYLQLQRITVGISHKVLNDTLKQLESDGLIHKESFQEVPPRVEYSLTTIGEELTPALNILQNWGKNHYKVNIKPHIKKVES